MQIHTIGIDLGKTLFHLVGLNLRVEIVVRRKCSRTQLLQFTANSQADLIAVCQTLIACLTQSGTATVRTRLPFPPDRPGPSGPPASGRFGRRARRAPGGAGRSRPAGGHHTKRQKSYAKDLG